MSLGASKPSGSTTTTQKTEPWEPAQPYLKDILGQASGFYNAGAFSPDYYPGESLASQSPLTTGAQDLTAFRALSGSPVNSAASGLLSDTLNGNYLDPASNPYLSKTYDAAAKKVQGSVNSAFGQGGRYGSGLNQSVLGENLGNLATDIYGGNYQQERNRQQQGLSLAPSIANQDYYDLDRLAGVGASQEAYQQGLLNADQQKYSYLSGLPANALSQYQNFITGTSGNSNTVTGQQPYYNNTGAGLLGTGLGVASLFTPGGLLRGLFN